jgi:peptidyl-tRNA hydrolase, PTH1 family
MPEEPTQGTRRSSPWLVVGLGNPGREYELSPHNIGFMVVDRLAEMHAIRVTRKDSKALLGVGEIEGSPVLLAKPQTFMNLSGVSVRALLEKHGLTAGDLVVVYDDHDLSWSSLRIRERGSAGGHHGMESVIDCIGTSEFVRLRLGIDPGVGKAVPDFLLKPFRGTQKKELDDFLGVAAGAVVSIIAEGVNKAMTKFNRRAQG